MKRAVVVLLLLIANAIVGARSNRPPAAPAPVADNSLGQIAAMYPLERARNAIAPFAFADVCL